MDLKEIEPSRYYSIRALAMMGILPWRSAYTVAIALKEEKWKNIFQPVLDQKKKSVRMHILGKNIIKYLEMVDSGEINK